MCPNFIIQKRHDVIGMNIESMGDWEENTQWVSEHCGLGLCGHNNRDAAKNGLWNEAK